MTDGRHETAMVVRGNQGLERNNPAKVTAVRAATDAADDYVPHLSPSDVKLMVDCAARNPRHGERNAALITVLFDGALRESEALGIRPCDIRRGPDGYSIAIRARARSWEWRQSLHQRHRCYSRLPTMSTPAKPTVYSQSPGHESLESVKMLTGAPASVNHRKLRTESARCMS